MGQVPSNSKMVLPRYALLGRGRLAGHFGQYFRFLDVPFLQWSRSDSDPLLQEILAQSDIALLAVSDSAIEPLIAKISNFNSKNILVHFSGALSTPKAQSAHPLMTFGEDLYSFETYKKIPFFLESSRNTFEQLFPTLPNPHFIIPAELKPLYHAFCVITGNFTHILWNEVFKQSKKDLHLPREVFLPYMEQVFSNLKHNPENTETGPLARKDIKTLQQNLRALKDSNLKGLYEAFVDFKEIKLNE